MYHLFLLLLDASGASPTQLTKQGSLNSTNSTFAVKGVAKLAVLVTTSNGDGKPSISKTSSSNATPLTAPLHLNSTNSTIPIKTKDLVAKVAVFTASHTSGTKSPMNTSIASITNKKVESAITAPVEKISNSSLPIVWQYFYNTPECGGTPLSMWSFRYGEYLKNDFSKWIQNVPLESCTKDIKPFISNTKCCVTNLEDMTSSSYSIQNQHIISMPASIASNKQKYCQIWDIASRPEYEMVCVKQGSCFDGIYCSMNGTIDIGLSRECRNRKDGNSMTQDSSKFKLKLTGEGSYNVYNSRYGTILNQDLTLYYSWYRYFPRQNIGPTYKSFPEIIAALCLLAEILGNIVIISIFIGRYYTTGSRRLLGDVLGQIAIPFFVLTTYFKLTWQQYIISLQIYFLLTSLGSLYSVMSSASLLMNVMNYTQATRYRFYKLVLLFHFITAGSTYCIFILYYSKEFSHIYDSWYNLFILWPIFVVIFIQIPIIYVFYRVATFSSNRLKALYNFWNKELIFRRGIKLSFFCTMLYLKLKVFDCYMNAYYGGEKTQIVFQFIRKLLILMPILINSLIVSHMPTVLDRLGRLVNDMADDTADDDDKVQPKVSGDDQDKCLRLSVKESAEVADDDEDRLLAEMETLST